MKYQHINPEEVREEFLKDLRNNNTIEKIWQLRASKIFNGYICGIGVLAPILTQIARQVSANACVSNHDMVDLGEGYQQGSRECYQKAREYLHCYKSLLRETSQKSLEDK